MNLALPVNELFAAIVAFPLVLPVWTVPAAVASLIQIVAVPVRMTAQLTIVVARFVRGLYFHSEIKLLLIYKAEGFGGVNGEFGTSRLVELE